MEYVYLTESFNPLNEGIVIFMESFMTMITRNREICLQDLLEIMIP